MKTEHEFKFKIILIPVFVSLVLLAFLDILSSIIVQPLILFLRDYTSIDTSDPNTNITINLLFNIVLNLSALITIYFIYIKKFSIIPKQKKNNVNGFYITLKTYFSLFTIVYITGIIFLALKEIYFPEEPLDSPYVSILPDSVENGFLNIILVIGLVAILAPVLEEMIFRRILIPLFEGTGLISTPMAVIVSSIMFGLIHTEADIINGSLGFAILHFTSATILGIGLGGVYIITRDVRYSMFYHGLNNGFALFSLFISDYFPSDISSDPNNLGPSENIILVFGGMILSMFLLGLLFIVLGIANIKKLKHPFISQFRVNLSNKLNLGIIGLIVFVQGILFVILPYIENLILESSNWDIFSLILINSVIPLFVFTVSIVFIRNNREKIKSISLVENEPLTEYVDTRYSYYHSQSMNGGFINEQNPIKTQKFCRSCGIQLLETPNIRFCGSCGFELYKN